MSNCKQKSKKAKSAVPAWAPNPDDYMPISWWRTLPPHAFGDIERSRVQQVLAGIAVLRGGADLGAALQGHPATAVGMALALVPIRKLTLEVDIAMTALLQTALNGDAPSVLVLSHVLGRAQWHDSLAAELGTAWLARHIAEPMSPEDFAANEAALAAAFGKDDDHDDQADV